MSELENKSREITQLQSKETKECKINIKTRFINQRIEWESLQYVKQKFQEKKELSQVIREMLIKTSR